MNKVFIMGRITKDLELKYSGNNTAVLRFNLAIDRKYTKEGEEKQADFPSCIAFGKTAEFISKYFSKGRKIAIAGRIKTGSYDKDGAKVYTTDVIVEETYFCDSKQAAGQAQEQDAGFYPIDDSDNELPF